MYSGAAAKPRVLFLSGLQVYPPVSGGTLRTFALGSALKRHGLDVFVYSLAGRRRDYLTWRRSSSQLWPEGVEEYVDRGTCGLLGQYASAGLSLPPLWITAYLGMASASPREVLLPARLRARLAACDVLVSDFPFAYPLFAAPSTRGRVRVLSTHNVEHHLYDDASGGRDRWLREVVRRTEIRAAAECDVLVACSASDQAFFATHARTRRSMVVPNGIDVRRFRGIAGQRSPTRHELGVPDDTLLFLFTGSKWGPNRDALRQLVDFSARNQAFLAERRIHILVVGGVAPAPLRMPGLTATGRVEDVERYFAAADVALNPLSSGAGTNVKMSEFLAVRLPVATTRLGARGFSIEDGETGFLFETNELPQVLSRIRKTFDESPGRLRAMAEAAYTANEDVIDMDRCVLPLVEALVDCRNAPAERRVRAG